MVGSIRSFLRKEKRVQNSFVVFFSSFHFCNRFFIKKNNKKPKLESKNQKKLKQQQFQPNNHYQLQYVTYMSTNFFYFKNFDFSKFAQD